MLAGAAEATTPADLTQLVELVKTLDAVGYLTLTLWALWKGWLKLPREVAKLEEDVVLWQRIALESLDHAEEAKASKGPS